MLTEFLADPVNAYAASVAVALVGVNLALTYLWGWK